MSMASKPWNDFLTAQLAQSEAFAVEYLNAALEEDDPAFLLKALRQVAEARGGVGELAQKTGLKQASLARMLSANGNPTMVSFHEILDALGLQMQFTLKRAA